VEPPLSHCSRNVPALPMNPAFFSFVNEAFSWLSGEAPSLGETQIILEGVVSLNPPRTGLQLSSRVPPDTELKEFSSFPPS